MIGLFCHVKFENVMTSFTTQMCRMMFWCYICSSAMSPLVTEYDNDIQRLKSQIASFQVIHMYLTVVIISDALAV